MTPVYHRVTRRNIRRSKYICQLRIIVSLPQNKKAPRFPGGLLCNCLAIGVRKVFATTRKAPEGYRITFSVAVRLVVPVPHLPPGRKQRKHHFLNRSGQRIVAGRREVNITRLLQTGGRTRDNSMKVIDRDV